VDDFDFDFDFEATAAPDICAILKRMDAKGRKTFDVDDEIWQLKRIMPELPKRNEVFKMLSVRGGFASIGLITYIASKERINHLYVSTFRIGLKQFDVLIDLHERGLLGQADFITSGMQGQNGAKYDYLSPIVDGCMERGWGLRELNNHSKIILAETNENWYVIETSSNLNENPKVEQFSFENDAGLFEFYEDFFKSILLRGR